VEGTYTMLRLRIAAALGAAAACLSMAAGPSAAYREVNVPDAQQDVEFLDAAFGGDWSHAEPAPDQPIGDIIAVRDRYGDKHFKLRVRTHGLTDEAGSVVTLIAHIETQSKRQRLTWDLVTRIADGELATSAYGTSEANADVVCAAAGATIVHTRWQPWVGLKCLRHAPLITPDVVYRRVEVAAGGEPVGVWRDLADGATVTPYCHDPVPPRAAARVGRQGC
jgi:hypothetical protein